MENRENFFEHEGLENISEGASHLMDILCACLQAAQPSACMLNLERYYEVQRARSIFNKLLQETSCRMSIHPTFLSASLCAEADSFEVCGDMALFQTLLELANTVEVYPLTDGKIRIAFTFRNFLTRLD